MPPYSKWIQRLGWATVAVGVLATGAWLGVPPLLKWQAQDRLTALLGRTVTLGEVEFSPLALSLTVRDVRIAGAPGDAASAPQLSVDRLFVDAQWRSLLERAPVVEALQVDAPKARVQRTAAGGTDIDDVLARLKPDPAQPKPPSEPLQFALYNLELKDGELTVDDRVVDRQHRVGSVHLALPFLSTLPDHLDVTVTPRLAFALNGAAFDSGAQATPFADDRASRLSLRIGDLDLQPWLPYLPASLPVRVQRGRLSADIGIAFAQPAGAAPVVSLSGSVQARDAAVADGRGGPLLEWTQLSVGLADVRPLEQKVALGIVRLEGASVQVRREADGRFAAQPPAAATATAAPPASAPSTPATPWKVQVERVEVAGARADWIDATTGPAAHWRFDDLQAEAGPVRWPDMAPAAVRLSTRWQAVAAPPPVPTKGAVRKRAGKTAAPASKAVASPSSPADSGARIAVEGTADTRAADLALSLQALDLRLLGPYLSGVLRPALDGRLQAKARLSWADGDQPVLRLAVERAAVEDLALRNAPASPTGAHRSTVRPPPALAWKLLQATDTTVDLLAREVRVGALELTRPEVRLQRDREGVWSAERWLAAAAPAAEQAPSAAARPGRGKSSTAAPRTQGAARHGAAAARSPVTESAAAAGPATGGDPWQMSLARFRLDGGLLALDDALPAVQPVRLRVQALQVGVRNAAWPPQAKAAAPRVELSARVRGLEPDDADVALPPVSRASPAAPGGRAAGRPGARAPVEPPTIDWRGTVAPQPVAAQGRLKVSRFPVHAFEPYFSALLPVSLRRAEANYDGDVTVGQQPAGWQARLKGEALLGDVQVMSRSTDAGDDAELLTWQSLALRALDVAVVPGSKPVVDIGEVVLSDFFSRLVITPQGRFNLQDVAQGEASAPSAAGGAPAAPASAPSAVAATPAARPPAAPGEGLPLVLSIGGVQLVNGKIDFTDRFVRPNFRTDLTELNGRLGAFRSDRRDMATIDLRGRAAGTAILEIRGSLNPTAQPLALDIQARATDLELAPLSPYAGKYAGYAIERGKLSVDLAYRIDPDGKLEAKNQVILNQLTFGEKVESPTATTLPVRLAVSLLTDRNGVIDINLPVSGSINDPQFSVFGIVMKVIGNLLMKALTAPFSLLAGGGTEDLSVVEFVPGTATPTAAGVAAIDKVAAALRDRPALRMTVTGASDPAGERAAMQTAAFEARVQGEYRRQALRAGASPDTPLPPITPETRQRAVRQLYADTKLPDKPRNLIGMVKDIPVPEMESRLLAATVVNTDTARELALQRSLAVRDALVARQLTSDRLFLAAPKLHAAGDDDKSVWTPRVQLALSTQ